MKDLIKEIENNLESKNYLSALTLTLILPDICGKVLYPYKGCGARYKDWYNEYIYPSDKSGALRGYFDELVPDGYMIYKLRCALLHSGSLDIDKEFLNGYMKGCKDKKDEPNLKFIITENSSSYNLAYKYTNLQNASEIRVKVGVIDFCRKICSAAKKFYYEDREGGDIYNHIVKLDFN